MMLLFPVSRRNIHWSLHYIPKCAWFWRSLHWCGRNKYSTTVSICTRKFYEVIRYYTFSFATGVINIDQHFAISVTNLFSSHENVIAPISAQKGLNTVSDVFRWLGQIFRLIPILTMTIRVMLRCQIFPLLKKIWFSRCTTLFHALKSVICIYFREIFF